ncbi:MAG: 6-bladed beta-propeller [Bacteroidia bacterium]|nr:6-bladed beta-propeller [Bacteroidia bacterium]
MCCFDVSGKFLYKIQRRGKGPGEYNQISDFLIDPDKKLIVILDRNSSKMIRYDLNGSYQDEISTSVKADQFGMIDNSTYLTYASLPFNVENQKSSENFYLLNHSGSVVYNPLIPKDPVLDNSHDGFITSNGNSTWFGCGYRDTIFELDKSGKLAGGYYLNFGSKQAYFLKKLKSMIGSKELLNFVNSYVGYSNLFKVIALKEKIFIFYGIRVNSSDMKTQTIILDLKTNSFIQATGKLINDFDGVPFLGVPSGCTSENELIYIIDNEQLTEAVKINKAPEFLKTYDKIKPLTESDNPVLAFVKLR